ncbi:hypothetical protein P4K96_23900, partial [Bacillus cereus]|nr:hypothetical protein [Bacillus cereus]
MNNSVYGSFSMLKKMRNYFRSKKTFDQYLNDLNIPLYFPNGPKGIKAISDLELNQYLSIAAHMTQAELLNPQNTSDNTIKNLALQSNIDHIKTLFFFCENP